jgi:threonine aldolase
MSLPRGNAATTPGSVRQARQSAVRQPSFTGKPRLDFRWEVHAPPTGEMWEAMQRASASLGIASLGQDQTVAELNTMAAELTGHEAALFLPTTTSCMTLAWQALGIAGKRVIMEARSHHYWAENLHISANAGATPVLIRGDKFGAMPLGEIEDEIGRYCGGSVSTALVSLENAHSLCGGTCLTPEYTRRAAELAHDYGCELSIDGARIFNSAVAQDVPVRHLAEPADFVAFSLGKGLAAPMGAMLCGRSDLIRQVEILARRSGASTIHKAGIMAAAGLVALQSMVPRLADDHSRARRLAVALGDVDGLAIDLETVQTNFVRVETDHSGITASELAEQAGRRGLAVHVVEPYAFKMVTAYTTSDEEIDEAIEIMTVAAAETEGCS